MTAEKEITKILYQDSTDCSEGMVIDFKNIQKVLKLLTDDKIKFAKKKLKKYKDDLYLEYVTLKGKDVKLDEDDIRLREITPIIKSFYKNNDELDERLKNFADKYLK